MSIHAKLNPEAEAKLRRQQRKSTIGSIVISMLVFALIVLALAFIFLKTAKKKNADIVSFAPQSSVENEIEKPEVTNEVERKPSAPSSVMNRVIATASVSNVSIPVPEVEVAEASLSFGDGSDFGEGWGSGSGDGSGGGGGLFGSTGGGGNRLQGYIYDLTQTRNNRPSKFHSRYTSDNTAWQDPYVSSVIRGGMRESELNKFYRGPKKLGIHQLMIPCSSDITAPKAFGAEGKMKPGAWLIVYRGKVRAPITGKIRFCGTADNYLGIRFQRKNVLYYASGTHSTIPVSPTQPVPGLRLQIAFGDWIDVREGGWYDIDILIGDAGGLFSGLVYYEIQGQGGKKYLFRTQDIPWGEVLQLDGKLTGGVRDLPTDLDPTSPVWECKSF